MSLTTTVIATSVASTGFFALATALKHKSAGQMPDAQGLQAKQLGRFVTSTLRNPLWLGGILADVGGLGLQIYALHIGALSVVQPVMITALLFSLVLNHRVARTRITGREIVWALVLIVALVGFLTAAGANSPENARAPRIADREPAVVVAILAVVLGAACVLVAQRLPRGRGAALIGVAVGITYASTAALLKSCTNVLAAGGIGALVTSWQLYVVIVVGAVGLMLSQLAFQAGPLTASLPAIATVDPLVSVALGVVVYEERLRSNGSAIFFELAFLTLLSVAAIFLSRMEGAVEDSVLPRTPAKA